MSSTKPALSLVARSCAALATVVGAAGCQAATADESAASAESDLTQAEVETSLVAQGYVHASTETYKVEYVTTERSSPSRMICVFNNSEWAFGRICYFVWRRTAETTKFVTSGERYEHPDGRIAYALDGNLIGPFKLGAHPIVGKWSQRTDGLDPAWRCDGWSNFNVDVLDFRLDNGVKVRLNVSGGRFPIPYAPAIESQLFGVEQNIGSYDVTDERVVVETTKAADGDTGSLKLAIRAGGKFRLSLSYQHTPPVSTGASFGSTVRYEGRDQDDACPLVECNAMDGARVVTPAEAPQDLAGANLQCGPFRTQSGVPAFLLPVWDPVRNACTFDRSLLVYRLAELEPDVNPHSFCPYVASGLPPRGPLRIGFSDVTPPAAGSRTPTIGTPQPANLAYGREYAFVECRGRLEDYEPTFWINGKGTPLEARRNDQVFGSRTERATCKAIRVE